MKTTNKDYVVYNKATGEQMSRVFFRRHYNGMINKFQTGFEAAIEHKKAVERLSELHPEVFTRRSLAIRVRSNKDY